MANLAKALTGMAALAFVAAVVTNFIGPAYTSSEGWSRAAVNLSLLALAVVICFRDDAGRRA